MRSSSGGRNAVDVSVHVTKPVPECGVDGYVLALWFWFIEEFPVEDGAAELG